MAIRSRVVQVYQLPEEVTFDTERSFMRELQECVETQRPCIVLDCSKLARMDIAAKRLLLSCLEEVMKRNGDVRLAALRFGAEAMLRMAGIRRLFEVYATIAEAAQSFQKRPVSMMPLAVEVEDTDSDSSYAA